jgi:putative sigma-54 modulation protein
MEIRLTWTHLAHSPALEDYFRHKAEHLEHFYKPILSADLELAHDKHHRKGQTYRAEGRIAIAKKTLYASEVADHPYEAVDLVLGELSKELTKHKERTRIEHSKRRNLEDKDRRRVTRIALRKPQ